MGLVLKSDLLPMVSSQTESSGPNSRGTTDAFLRDDPNQDEWSKFTQIMVHQMNQRFFSQGEFVGFFGSLQ